MLSLNKKENVRRVFVEKKDFSSSTDYNYFNMPSTVIILGFLAGVGSILPVLVSWLNATSDKVYLAVGHYYQDYFVYLQAIVQGMRGRWLVDNPYASDDPSKTFLVFWPYLVLGRLGGLFKLSPIVIYWLTTAVIGFFTVLVLFQWIKKLMPESNFWEKIIALIFYLLATPFSVLVKNPTGFSLEPYTFWYAYENFFRRFERVPHHFLGMLLSYILLYRLADFFERKSKGLLNEKSSVLFLIILTVLILSFYPYQVITLCFSTGFLILLLIASDFIKKRDIRSWLFFSFIYFAPVLVTAFFFHWLSHQSGVIVRNSQIDLRYMDFPPAKLIILTTGPLGILGILGIRNYLKKINYFRIFLGLYVLISIVLSFSRFSLLVGNFNFRFLTPAWYLFLAVLSVWGIKNIAFIFGRLRPVIYKILVSLFITYFLIVNLDHLGRLINDPGLFGSMANTVSKKIVAGWQQLNKEKDKGVVLTAPSVHLPLVLPIFADKKVYIARMGFTPDYDQKAVMVAKIYQGEVKEEDFKDFLRINQIKFIVWTAIEGYPSEVFLRLPWLKKIYQNEEFILFRVN